MTLPPRGVRPEPFSAYTTPEFWDDPHISAQMLAHHLDPATAAASRPHAFIDASVDWLRSVLGLGPGSRVLDLGCGPGLYAVRLARRGVRVLGVDASARSLAHARLVADAEGLPVEFVQGNYLTAPLGEGHDGAILIYEDYSALSPAQRVLLLGRVRDALRLGGQVVFDVAGAPFDPGAPTFAVRAVRPYECCGVWLGIVRPGPRSADSWIIPEVGSGCRHALGGPGV